MTPPEGYGESVFKAEVAPPPEALEKVVEKPSQSIPDTAPEKKDALVRKMEIQRQVMTHLGYGLEHTSDPVSLLDQWRVSGLADAFDTEWRSKKIQDLLEQNASDDIIAQPIDVALNNIVPSFELKNLLERLWPPVEKRLKERLQVHHNNVLVFTPLQKRWEQLFNQYLREKLNTESGEVISGSQEDEIVNFIAENTQGYSEELKSRFPSKND